ncbi:hypothetical protein BD410DRAFT_783608 [Rickenella mellea]|uniref:Uncharacterized protein n=1 Tax=Rickenella mellea TaxID=50990 RepID=A0A4Y7QHH6_9AGAM|nr:hypothetical protein BD410DRAFT_783608 [Rickenella mellea]
MLSINLATSMSLLSFLVLPSCARLSSGGSNSGNNGSRLSKGVIAAIIVGCILVVLVKIAIIFCLCRCILRRRRASAQPGGYANSTPMGPYAQQPAAEQGFTHSGMKGGGFGQQQHQFGANNEMPPPQYGQTGYAAPTGPPPAQINGYQGGGKYPQ